MKTRNRFLLAAVMIGGALFSQSCDEGLLEGLMDPVFPTEVVEKVIEDGEEVTEFNIKPNLDWTVELKGEGVLTHFWIDDNGIKSKSISGKAGEDAKFSVVFSKEKEFEKARICEVILTMAGHSKKIGTITRPGLEPMRIVKSAVKGDDFFTKNYEEVDLEKGFVLETFAETKDYERPISIFANYGWSLVVPEWCSCYIDHKLVEGSVEGEANKEVKLTIQANITKALINGLTDKITIRDKADPEKKYVDVPVTLPSVAGRIYVPAPNSTEFTADGKLKLMMGNDAVAALCYGFCSDDVELRAFEWNSSEYYEVAFPTWFHTEVEADASGNPDEVLKSFTFSFTVDNNSAAKNRIVDVIAFPKSELPEVDETASYLNLAGDAFTEKFEKYKVARFTQDAGQEEVLGELFSLQQGKAELKAMSEDDLMYNSIKNKFKTSQIYTLTTKDFTTILNYTGPEVWDFPIYQVGSFDKLDDNSIYVEPMMGMESTSLYVYVGESVTDYAEAILVMEGETSEEKPVNTIAAVKIVYDMNAEIAGGNDYFTAPYGGATVRKLVQEDDMYYYLNNEYPECKEIYEVVATGASTMLNYDGPEFWSTPVIQASEPYNKPLTDGSVTCEPMGQMLTIYIGETITTRTEAIIRFEGEPAKEDEAGPVLALVHFIFNPASAGDEPIFSFVNASQTGATLEAASADEVNALQSNFSGVKEGNVYKLTYNQEYPPMCMVNVPDNPFSLIGWNCEFETDQWLTAEAPDPSKPNQWSIMMSKTGATDYFVWKSGEMFQYLLICTRTK